MKQTLIIVLILFLLSCSKEKELIPNEPPIAPEQWEKFAGNYKIYDTLGVYLYDLDMIHYFSGKNVYGNDVDSLILQNFADTFDVKYEFRNFTEPNNFDFGFHDSIVDRNNKTWGLWSLSDDLTTTARENYLINDTIILYFKMDNIKYYIPEAQPYYRCECKHVAVKQ